MRDEWKIDVTRHQIALNLCIVCYVCCEYIDKICRVMIFCPSSISTHFTLHWQLVVGREKKYHHPHVIDESERSRLLCMKFYHSKWTMKLIKINRKKKDILRAMRGPRTQLSLDLVCSCVMCDEPQREIIQQTHTQNTKCVDV